MKRIIVDSSVIIDFTRAKKGDFLRLSELSSRGKVTLCIASVVFLEIWAGSSMGNPKIFKETKKVLSIFKIYDLTRQIAETAGELIRKGKVLTTLDAVIASTALYLDAELATSNNKHFVKVKGLRLFKLQKSS